jgi:predicted phosphodiesterase
MRIAALYDIHANLPALQAVLEQVRRARADHIVVGGDVLPGPMPRDTLQRLLDLDIPVHFIYGNGEVAVLRAMAGQELAGVPEVYQPSIRWTAEQVHDQQQTLAAWPMTLQLEIPGLGGVLFCHATPRNENECFTRLTPDDRLLPIFDGLTASLIVCGHTHMQFDRVVGGTRVVNAGSVGMPFGEPGADWLLLGAAATDRGDDEPVQMQHTAYDLAKTAELIRATRYPWPEDFAARYVLNPPSAAAMLDVFTRASI